MKKINYFFNFILSYRNIFFQVFFFEIFYSFKFREFIPLIKVHNNKSRTDSVPCVYFFLHEISKFLKRKGIKSIVDIGSGYGRVVNFISSVNRIKTYGIEYDNEVFKSALKIKKKRVSLYCGDVFAFNLKKLNSKCFILVDPFKRVTDRNKFLSKIKKLYPHQKKYIIIVNDFKGNFPKEFKLVYSVIGSKTRTLQIFKIC